MPGRTIEELSEQVEAHPVVNLSQSASARDIGGRWSCVARSVEWVSQLGTTITHDEAITLDQHDADRSPLAGKLVIVGGGVVGPGRAESAVEALLRQHPAAVVMWGIGHDVQLGAHRDHSSRWRKRVLRDGHTRLWPEWLADAQAVGVRDWNSGMPWVPCASAMLTAFDELRDTEPTYEFMVLNDHEQGIATHEAIRTGRTFEHITDSEELETVLETMAAARVVVTNSYHAAYWALLLGRAAVVVDPASTRFRGFRWPVTYAHRDTWLAAVERAQPAPHALTEARAASYAFSTRVFSTGQDLGLISPSSDLSPTRGTRVWRAGAAA